MPVPYIGRKVLKG